MAIQIWQKGDKIKNGRFEIISRLDKGGFGIIYLAKDTKRNNKNIVIKTLNPYIQSLVDFPTRQEKFIDEGVKHRGFKHPHIVKIHDLIRVSGLSCFVMEYIPGQNLDKYVKKHGKLSEEKALLYIDQVSQALDCIHEEKYIHRDVHPANIMKRQDLDQTVLIDFGIAEEFFDETCSVSSELGMEFYKPVEQYEKRVCGACTDIYALAATLYYLLAGVTVGHGAHNFKSIQRKFLRDRGEVFIEKTLWEELAHLGISEKTQAAIKAGMGIEPRERPQTIAEFRELLGLVRLNNQISILNLENICSDETGYALNDSLDSVKDKANDLLRSGGDSAYGMFDNVKLLLDETRDIGDDPFNFGNPLDAVKDRAAELIPDLGDDPFDFGRITGKAGDFIRGKALPHGDKKTDISKLDTLNPKIDTVEQDLTTISLDDSDEDPFAGLSSLYGQVTSFQSGKAVS